MDRSTACVLLLSGLTAWSGCGDSGDGGPAPEGNVFAALAGTYAVLCVGSSPGNGIPAGASADGSITLGALIGADRAEVSVRFRDYADPGCASGAVNTDATVSGEIRDLGQPRPYVLNGEPVTAQVVELTYRGVSFAGAGYGGSLPTPGMTAKAAFLLVGNRLHISTGHRDADGVGERLSAVHGLRQ